MCYSLWLNGFWHIHLSFLSTDLRFVLVLLHSVYKYVGWCKKVLTHWSYVFLAQTHRNGLHGPAYTFLEYTNHPQPWWRHQMETFSALLAICAGNSPVPGEFPTQRPVTRSFDVYFDQRPNKRLSKQSRGWWFETLSWSLWRHCNAKNKR